MADLIPVTFKATEECSDWMCRQYGDPDVSRSEFIRQCVRIEIALREIDGKNIPAVTSLQVAAHFGKNHKDVLRDIRVTIEKCSQEFNERNFAPVEYTDAKGERKPPFLDRFGGSCYRKVVTPRADSIGGPSCVCENHRCKESKDYVRRSQAFRKGRIRKGPRRHARR